MILRYKKTFSIVFAILVGVGIIFFALKGESILSTKNSTIKNDVEWRDSLSIVPNTSSSTTFVSGGNEKTGDMREDQTVTGALAQDFMISYTNAKSGTESTSSMTEEEATMFAEDILSKHPAAPVKQYVAKDLVIIEVSTSTVTTYKKEVSVAMNTFLSTKPFDELSSVSRALNTNDATELEPLVAAVANYQKLVASLLLIKVPSTAVDFHLYVIQSYATILSGLIDLQNILVDPVRGSQGLTKYSEGMNMVLNLSARFK